MEDFEDFVPSIIDTENGNSNDNYSWTPFYQPSMEIIIMLCVMYGSLSLVTVLSNSMVIYIFLMSSSRPMQSILDYLIANLALADLIIGLICIPFSFQAALLQSWNHLPDFLCWVLPFVENMSLNVSIFCLTAIAIDR